MRGKRATSYDVAKLAGVSQSAVSRTFSPNKSASKKTRAKVLAAAQELGFVPDPIAKSLSLGRSRLAGLVVTQYAQQNYPVALKSAVDVMTETGDSILLQIVDATDDGDTAIARLLRRRVDVILCAAGVSEAAARTCAEASVPLVLINRRLNFAGVDQVGSNHAMVMRGVAQHLKDTGTRRTVFLDAGEGNWVAAERRRGYVAACAHVGLPEPDILVGDFDYEGGFKAVAQMGDAARNFDAFVAANDPMAIGAIDALTLELGLSIPADVQVIGHDDTAMARLRGYRLTSIRQDMRTILSKAIEMAYGRLEEPQREDADLLIDSTFVPRGSTRD
ncbi:MAG: LacI family transcriptional regulator [Alphaproteobacteria bacterium]|nr:LacI family transcriptional regulator [Alphaproteobacteria bacterium]